MTRKIILLILLSAAIVLAQPTSGKQAVTDLRKSADQGNASAQLSLPIVDAFRTLVVYPPPAVRAVFQRARELAVA